MPNPQRGEIEAVIGDRPRTLCLTLGALAELESALDCADLVALAERFETGHISAREAIAVIGAGLRGAGGTETDGELAALRIEDGATGAIRLVARLLSATFAADAPTAPSVSAA